MANRPSTYNGWITPESAANTATPGCLPQYPRNNATQTKSGHIFELDDTTDRERIRLQHRSGTFIEMHPNGDEVHKVYGNGYEITVKDKNILIKGKCNITVEGNVDINIKGDKTEYIEGNYEIHVGKSLSQTVGGSVSFISAGDMDLKGGAGLDGQLTLSAGDCVYINSDMIVEGDMTAEKITSTTSIVATTGPVVAGLHGFNSKEGGLALGEFAAAGLNSALELGTGSVWAGTSVTTPMTTSGISDSFWQFDVINFILHNLHLHPALGLSPPVPPEIG